MVRGWIKGAAQARLVMWPSFPPAQLHLNVAGLQLASQLYKG